jgi:transcriptional regulator with XRE-family HTH domain
MASDGTPELCAIRCGEAVARIRTTRGWTRLQLLTRLASEIDPADPCVPAMSETWLARLENGRMVKIPRSTIEALCRALRCTVRERAWILLQADRNALAERDEADPAAEAMVYIAAQLYAESQHVVEALVGRRDPVTLDDDELLEIASIMLERALARRQRQPAPSRAS